MHAKFIPLILFSVLLNASAQLFLRKGMAAKTLAYRHDLVAAAQDAMRIVLDPWVMSGLACYAISIVSWMAVLSKVDVSYAYPFLSVGYVVVVVAAYFLFREPMGVAKILGVGLICIGVMLVARGE
jgi:multidrug transporter EmrE-like cation transporter